MDANKYSEQDIQDYASGSFRGDQRDFETFLNENPRAWVMVNEYQELFNSLRKHETPELSFNLSDAVFVKIEEKKYAKERLRFNILSLISILLTIGALITTYQYLNIGQLLSSASNAKWYLLSSILIVLFSLAFYRLDVKQMEKRFSY